jgi:hypothetical protein
MPYEQGDKISFTDGIDTFQLNVYETNRTSYSYRKAFSSRAICQAEAQAKLSSNSSLPQFNMYGASANLPRAYNIFFNDNIYFNFIINTNGIASTNYDGLVCENLDKFDNGFKEYVDVLKVTYDTLVYTETEIYQVFLAKKIGVIQFNDRFNHKRWNLIGK